jgi:AraC-like DNA-binding protein
MRTQFGCARTAIAIDSHSAIGAVPITPEPSGRDPDVDPSRDYGRTTADLTRAAVVSVLSEDRFSIKAVAAAFGLTERTFRRRLTEVGLSYFEILQEFRIARAVRALRESDISVTDLAFDLGYTHAQNFTRAFKQSIGVSPNDYRMGCQRSLLGAT